MSDRPSLSILQLSGHIESFYDEYVVIKNGRQACLWNGTCLKSLLCNPIDDGYLLTLVANGGFLTPFSSDPPIQTPYFEIDHETQKVNPSMAVIIDYHINKAIEVNDLLYASSSIDYEDEKLLVIDKSKSPPKVINSLELDWYKLDVDSEVIICACNRGRKFIGFSHELEELWSIKQEDNDRNYSVSAGGPWLWNDSAIFCINYEIISVEKNTGDILWKHKFDVTPTYIELAQDKLYVAAQLLFVIDAKTGSTVQDADLGLAYKNERSGERNYIKMLPACKYVVVICPVENNIKLLSPDNLSCIDTITPPEGYLLENMLSAHSEIKNEKLVLTLEKHNSYIIRALMMIDFSAYQSQDQVYYMPKPPISYYFAPRLDIEHSYSITIDTNHTYEVTGYAEVAVKEIAGEIRQSECDGDYVKTEWVDELHNGIINVILDPEGFDEHEKETIKLEIEKLNEDMNSRESTLQMLGLFPKTVPPMQVQVKFLNKSEWSKEGEQFDFDEFIAEKVVS